MKLLLTLALFAFLASAINLTCGSPFGVSEGKAPVSEGNATASEGQAPVSEDKVTASEGKANVTKKSPDDEENDLGPVEPEDGELPPGSILLPEDYKPGDKLPDIKSGDGLQGRLRCVRYRRYVYCYYFRRNGRLYRRCYYRVVCIRYSRG